MKCEQNDSFAVFCNSTSKKNKRVILMTFGIHIYIYSLCICIAWAWERPGPWRPGGLHCPPASPKAASSRISSNFCRISSIFCRISSNSRRISSIFRRISSNLSSNVLRRISSKIIFFCNLAQSARGAMTFEEKNVFSAAE